MEELKGLFFSLACESKYECHECSSLLQKGVHFTKKVFLTIVPRQGKAEGERSEVRAAGKFDQRCWIDSPFQMHFWCYHILPTWQFANLTFCQLDILPTWCFGNLTFCQLDIFDAITFCQLDILPVRHFLCYHFLPTWHFATYHFANLSFCQLVNFSSCHFFRESFGPHAFINLPFHQCAILSTWYFIWLPFCQITILSTRNFANLIFCQLAISSITQKEIKLT